MNSLSFSEPNLVNPEPIEWPLNSVFTNKYGKINGKTNGKYSKYGKTEKSRILMRIYKLFDLSFSPIGYNIHLNTV